MGGAKQFIQIDGRKTKIMDNEANHGMKDTNEELIAMPHNVESIEPEIKETTSEKRLAF